MLPLKRFGFPRYHPSASGCRGQQACSGGCLGGVLQEVGIPLADVKSIGLVERWFPSRWGGMGAGCASDIQPGWAYTGRSLAGVSVRELVLATLPRTEPHTDACQMKRGEINPYSTLQNQERC